MSRASWALDTLDPDRRARWWAGLRSPSRRHSSVSATRLAARPRTVASMFSAATTSDTMRWAWAAVTRTGSKPAA